MIEEAVRRSKEETDAFNAMSRKRCYKCGKLGDDDPAGLQRCSRCRNAFYCGRRCQQDDWSRHRAECREVS
ncbi:hypothetical protein DFJ74DRAFT_648431 [Hyaloraphidium curvatum]|nr:hypothetical protein DFJ74DRAFT_648431 [Hyaloraphidium curvatum]